MRSSRQIRGLIILVLALSFGSGGASTNLNAAEDPPLEIKFGKDKASLSGVIDSEETGESLARTILSARPDLSIANGGIIIRPGVQLPPLDELKSFVSELGIATHEGGIKISDDEFRITGLTDSVVTVTALMIRLEPIKGDRQLINHICIVPSDDLPDLGVSLSGGQTVGPLINFDKITSRQDSFESPGILLGKISALVDFASDFDRLEGKKPRAKLITGATIPPATATGTQAATVGTLLTETPTTPAEPGVILARPLTSADLTPPPIELDPIRFSRNTVLLQANQTALLDQWMEVLANEEFAGQPITIRAMKPAAGSGAFNEWLCERRAGEVKKLLGERGVGENLCSVEIHSTESNVDAGEVALLVERKPVEIPVMEEEVATDPATAPSEKLEVSNTIAPSVEASSLPAAGTEN